VATRAQGGTRAVLTRPWGRAAAVVAVAVLAGLAVWLLAVRGSGGPGTVHPGSETTDVSAATLRALVAEIQQPVYWVGPQHGVTYEFTDTTSRRIYVRYLPDGVAAGSAQPYLTVASYPVVNAFAVTRAAANRPHTIELPVNGGVGFYAKTRPTDAWIAFPGSDTQIELYDPSGAQLRQLVAAGRIQRVSS
jgi:hypothetical protein